MRLLYSVRLTLKEDGFDTGIVVDITQNREQDAFVRVCRLELPDLWLYQSDPLSLRDACAVVKIAKDLTVLHDETLPSIVRVVRGDQLDSGTLSRLTSSLGASPQALIAKIREEWAIVQSPALVR